jgi:hypothetical protein
MAGAAERHKVAGVVETAPDAVHQVGPLEERVGPRDSLYPAPETVRMRKVHAEHLTSCPVPGNSDHRRHPPGGSLEAEAGTRGVRGIVFLRV